MYSFLSDNFSYFSAHDLSDADVKQERRKIKRLMTKQQYPKLIVKRLSPQEITKWLKGVSDENQNKQENDFKLLALNSVMKNVSVALPRISPSKFPTSFVLKNEEIEINDDSTDDEVIIQPQPIKIHILNDNAENILKSKTSPRSPPKVTEIVDLNNGGKKRSQPKITEFLEQNDLNNGGKKPSRSPSPCSSTNDSNNGGKKRSRSPSPTSSTSTSSSKEENPGNSNCPTNKRLCRDSSASPEISFATDENRKVLGTLKNQIFEDHEGEKKSVTRKRGRPSKTSPRNSIRLTEIKNEIIEEQIIKEEVPVQNIEENGDAALNGRPHSR